MTWLIILLVYIFGIAPVYIFFDKKTSYSKFNKIWFSAFWPAVIMSYFIYLVVRFFKEGN